MTVLTPTTGLAVVSLVSAAVYGLWLLHKPPSSLRAVVKTLAVGAVAVIAWLNGQGWLLAVGLTLSALGDAFLAGDPKRWLPLGLCAFLLAHAAYIVVFIHAGGGELIFRSQPVRLAGVLAAIAAGIFMIRLLWPSLGPMKGPVAVYLFAITAMTVTAFTLPWARWPAMAGAAAFSISDAILAMRLFRYEGRPNRAADLAVWWLYYAAQVGIAAALLLTPKGSI